MRSSFKRIGAYVQQVNARNAGLTVTNLQGVSINKFFMPSVANVNGTDLSTYKVVYKDQFAFNPMHVGRDEVLPIAMLETDDPVIVSPAYAVFEIIDKQALLPEYLMMWCRRPEFDRNAWFTTDSSVRGGFSWDDFCEMLLPVPSPEKQREIVKEYHTIVDRITLNERLNRKLEETAQAIYKQWFVDFEFPISAEYAAAIGKPELEGQPYKSSGGEMVFNEVLKQDIPKGWADKKLGDISSVVDNRGKTPPHTQIKTDFPLIEIASLRTSGRIVDLNACSKYLEEQIFRTWFRSGHPLEKDILFSTVGSLAQLKLFWGTRGSIAQNIVAFRCSGNLGLYVYQYLTNKIEDLLSYEIGSVQASIKVSHVIDYKLLIPSMMIEEYNNITTKVTDKINNLASQIALLKNLNILCLARLSKL
jgi:type I restriction enzyme S subunit